MNEGFYRLVRLNAPQGTVVNCAHPGAVVGGWETGRASTTSCFKAFSPALPERHAGRHEGHDLPRGLRRLRPPPGDYYCYLETIAGGYGGRRASTARTRCRSTARTPRTRRSRRPRATTRSAILRYGLVEDSEGAGQWRGAGSVVRRDYLFLDHDPTFTVLADRDRRGPWGLFGGLAGRKAHYILNPGRREPATLGSKGTVELKAGDVVSYRTSGGGGYGPPEERDPALVLRDVRDGKVSRARPRSLHVAIDPVTGAVDPTETARLRAANDSRPKRSAALPPMRWRGSRPRSARIIR